MILEAYQENRLKAVTFENLLKAKLRARAPRNRIHEALRLNGKATPQASKQQRRT